MKQYLGLLKDVMINGIDSPDRTGVGRRRLFGRSMRFNLFGGFPLLTTKKIHFRSVAYELLWFLRGDTNIKFLQDNNVHIWDSWAEEDGDVGPLYGSQLRNYEYTEWDENSWRHRRRYLDQLQTVIDQIKSDPYSSRHVISLWTPSDIPHVVLPPCHGTVIQFFVQGSKLDCQMYQRSCDVGIGIPYNIASYSLLLMMVANVTGYEPGEFVHVLGDTHIYLNHIDQLKLQLSREPLPLPTVELKNRRKSIDDFVYEDIVLNNYTPHPFIKMEVAV